MAKGLCGVTDAFRPDNLKKVGGVMAGLVAGNFINEKLDSAMGQSGVDGLSDMKGWIAPLATVAIGYAVGTTAKSDMLKNVGFGATLAGGVKLVNKLWGKPVVALGDADETLGLIPGIGDVTTTPASNTFTDADGNVYEYVDETQPQVNGVEDYNDAVLG